MRPLTIGQVARHAGVGIETVRFYEKEGLLEEPSRGGSGYRQYEGDVVTRLRFIRRARARSSLISFSENPRYFRVNRDKVGVWIANGELRAVNVATRLGGRPRYRITWESLEEFKRSRSTVRRQMPMSRRRHRKEQAIIPFF